MDNNDMLLDIDDDDETHEQSNGRVNGNHAMNVDLLLGNGSSRANESAGIPPKRPTREAVLKRLSEALMRRTLTKVSSDTDLRRSCHYYPIECCSRLLLYCTYHRLTCHNVDCCPRMRA